MGITKLLEVPMFEKVTKHFKVAALRRRIRKLRIDEAAQIAVVNAQVDVINKAKSAPWYFVEDMIEGNRRLAVIQAALKANLQELDRLTKRQ
jgi:hypothetical protein|uniref:Uncharacterized protein n=6 Tax=root TaxID=1 RepID=A0A8S5UIP8_9CAUD|nr:MAG TPA: hypothetical protein [Myoviridae sp. ctu2j3]DAF94384.1 MAG TPA: hypothetical protein [Myoviridae sp. ctu2j3]